MITSFIMLVLEAEGRSNGTSLWTWGGTYSPIATATTYGLMTVVMSAASIRAPSAAAAPGYQARQIRRSPRPAAQATRAMRPTCGLAMGESPNVQDLRGAPDP